MFATVIFVSNYYYYYQLDGTGSSHAPKRRGCFLRLHGCQHGTCSREYFCLQLDLGAAYGTAKAGTGISSISIWRPGVVMKSLIPVVMAGILGIYGMIVAVIITQNGILLNIQSKIHKNIHKNKDFPIWPQDWFADSVAWYKNNDSGCRIRYRQSWRRRY